MLQTEYEFTLPKGYVDVDGNLHQKGMMRLATAADEILPSKDPRVQRNPNYLPVIVLSRVVSKLGELQDVNPGVIEKLFVGDLTFLQDLYRHINGNGDARREVSCPKCGEAFVSEEDIPAPGE
jgi:hypothetical protein